MSNSIIGRDLAVDLGTANTLVYVRGRGVVIDLPSVVALNRQTSQLVALGNEARGMIGRAPEPLAVVRPVRGGVIVDVEAAAGLLAGVIARTHRRRYFAKPRLLVTVPSWLDRADQHSVQEAAHRAGARQVTILPAPAAAAIGAGLPVHEPVGNLVVTLGAGTTEAAVLSLGGIVVGRATDQAGDAMGHALAAWLAADHDVLIGEGAAEQLKISLGSAYPGDDEPEAEVRGRHVATGRPHSVVVTATAVRRALEAPLDAIVATVRETLDQAPPELAADVMDRGIVLTGGGALLRGLDERLRQETGVPVHVADRPARATVVGAGHCVDDLDAWAFSDRRPA